MKSPRRESGGISKADPVRRFWRSKTEDERACLKPPAGPLCGPLERRCDRGGIQKRLDTKYDPAGPGSRPPKR